jgi:hypothetical protein
MLARSSIVACVLTLLDTWLGKTLFLPPIVKLCHVTRQSQFAISRLFWLAAALDGFWRAESLFLLMLFGLISLLMVVATAMRADLPTRSSLLMRMIALLLLAEDLWSGATSGQWAGAEFWLIVLLAQYAATIRTLPPSSQGGSSAAQAT